MEGLINIAKIVFVVVALPIVIAATGSFNHVLDRFSFFSVEFRAGILAYVIAHLFIYPFKIVYNAGQQVTGGLFKFSKMASQVIPLFVPFFCILLLLGFWLAHKNHWHGEQGWAFSAGLTLAMHVILTAQSLQGEDSNAVKPHYFFLMTWVYLVNISLIVILLSFISDSITWKDFFATAMTKAEDIYQVLFQRLL